MDDREGDVVVAGGSVAGLSAALMLGRARRRVVVLDSGEPRNRFAAHMHGVLGHEGTEPRQLGARGREEVTAYGVELRTGSVEHVEDRGTTLAVHASDGSVLSCRALIVATGIVDRLPDVPGLAERWGRSVLHCPYCHGWEVRDRRLGVLATSPVALHQVQLVRQWSDRVTFFSGGDPVDGDTERRLAARQVDIVASPVVEVVGAGDGLRGVRTADGQLHELDALFTMGAPEPRDGFLDGLRLDRRETPLGSFLDVDATGRTTHPRIWAAGNIVDPAANVPMAASTGAKAGAVVNMALVDEDFDRALDELGRVA